MSARRSLLSLAATALLVVASLVTSTAPAEAQSDAALSQAWTVLTMRLNDSAAHAYHRAMVAELQKGGSARDAKLRVPERSWTAKRAKCQLEFKQGKTRVRINLREADRVIQAPQARVAFICKSGKKCVEKMTVVGRKVIRDADVKYLVRDTTTVRRAVIKAKGGVVVNRCKRGGGRA